jgi:glutathione S-transferase
LPYGVVPAMADNGVVMYESTIINEKLEKAYPQTPLLPKELGLRTNAHPRRLSRQSSLSRHESHFRRHSRRQERTMGPR